ncbi:cytidylyltransferase domain-containing protein [Actinoplanes sp. NPDC051859]|uniref:cytidylyltransferase domain-containing protein n=1 Tax=Actinoplanes sp. NPDC051859 TaxID=3363909 RepID=UPI0037BAAB8F
MKYVIPAKRSSSRVPDKNYRDFAHGKSLLDILVTKLSRLGDPADVYISSEDESTRILADKYGVSFLPRPAHLTENSYPFQSVVNEVCKQLPGDDDVMWCHATDPFFDEHEAVVRDWHTRDVATADSIVVVYPMAEYLLDQSFHPIGFGFGPWHRPSQELPTFYQLGFSCSIMTRHVATTLGLVGARPMWFKATNLTIDIDTQAQFDLAARLYALDHE